MRWSTHARGAIASAIIASSLVCGTAAAQAAAQTVGPTMNRASGSSSTPTEVPGGSDASSAQGASATPSGHTWFLQNQPYYSVTLAEPRGTQTSVLFPAVADSFPFAVNNGRSLVWDLSVGREIPIVGYDSNPGNGTPTGVAPRAFGIGLWFPLSFHMIEDMEKDPSNPILDTDYRFGGAVKVQWGLPAGSGGLSSGHLGVKFQFGHESTHIGDEFTLGALRTHPDFLRVNVSYEYYEIAGSFEPNLGADGRYQLRIRGGTIWLWRPANGWYSRELLQPYGSFVAGSNRNHEPYVQAELYRAPQGTGRLGPILSADIRDRTIYQYVLVPDASFRNPPEPTEWSVNLMAGLRQVRMGAGSFGKISPTYYLRAYHGVNPAGQFRSQSRYSEFGFGVQFDF